MRALGFTLAELLVAIAVLVGIMGIIFGIIQETSSAWKKTTGKVESFRGARGAFEAMTRTLSQATLNTYYDYVDANGFFRGSGMSSGSLTTTFIPFTYARQSDLHFVCGQGSTLLTGLSGYTPATHAVFFQAPMGTTTNTSYNDLDQLLNACGFYVVYGPDPAVPSFLGTSYPTKRYRYRLMQFTQQSEGLSVFQTPSETTSSSTPAAIAATRAWFTYPIVTAPDATSNMVLAENVVALIIWPKLSSGDQTPSNSLTSDYSYDSRSAGTFSTTTGFPATFNQLPPIVEVTMVAIDEASAIRLGNTTTPPNAQVGLTSSLFTSATYPTVAGQSNQLQLDLQSMQNSLNASHLNFRVFQTEVSIRGAKWTTKPQY